MSLLRSLITYLHNRVEPNYIVLLCVFLYMYTVRSRSTANVGCDLISDLRFLHIYMCYCKWWCFVLSFAFFNNDWSGFIKISFSIWLFGFLFVHPNLFCTERDMWWCFDGDELNFVQVDTICFHNLGKLINSTEIKCVFRQLTVWLNWYIYPHPGLGVA